MEGVTGATAQEVAQAVILAQGGSPNLQDRLPAIPRAGNNGTNWYRREEPSVGRWDNQRRDVVLLWF